ncbi:MAG TPA: hypothetical protein VFT66_19015 [Roseiflexaceae bacterium]|nr:hypothetical protein [Roseiflexaceae bacterium]
MTTHVVSHHISTEAQPRMAFERLAGFCGLAAAAANLVYAIAFIVLHDPLLSGLALLLGNLLATAVLCGLYMRVRAVEGGFAVWALLLGTAGALGGTIHGGYDLANALHPPTALAAVADLPSAIDPRGLLTFGVAGIGLLVFAALIGRSGSFPRGLATLGYVLAALLIVLYLGRLIVLDATSLLILGPALLSGFIVSPLWNAWVGIVLWRGELRADA